MQIDVMYVSIILLFVCSVYARMEDLAEESLYFLLKSDLLSSLEIGRRQNSHSKTEDSGVQDRRLVFALN